MTTAKFDYQKGELLMDVSGHALAGESGKDPVCAGASTLAVTVWEYVQHMDADSKLRCPPEAEIDAKNGHVYVKCKPSFLWLPEALNLWKFAETGFCLLAHNYPEHVVCETYVAPMEE